MAKHFITDLTGMRFGIEIECGGIRRTTAANTVRKVVGGYVWQSTTVIAADDRQWKIKNDASLTTWNDDLRCELVSPILTYEDLPLLEKIVKALRAVGAKVSAKCGIHIHVDGSMFTGEQLVTLAKLVYQQEPLITMAFGISDNRRAKYCKPTDDAFIAKLKQYKPKTKEELNPLWYGKRDYTPSHYDSTRYHGVNFHALYDHGTVEFRWFEATLNPEKITAYVQFVLALAKKAMLAKAACGNQRTDVQPENAKYVWRCYLLRLGMIGDEYAAARKVLMALLPGDAAYHDGVRPENTLVNA